MASVGQRKAGCLTGSAQSSGMVAESGRCHRAGNGTRGLDLEGWTRGEDVQLCHLLSLELGAVINQWVGGRRFEEKICVIYLTWGQGGKRGWSRWSTAELGMRLDYIWKSWGRGRDLQLSTFLVRVGLYISNDCHTVHDGEIRTTGHMGKITLSQHSKSWSITRKIMCASGAYFQVFTQTYTDIHAHIITN